MEHLSARAHSTLFLFLFLFLFHLSTIIVVLLYTSVNHNYGGKNGDDMDDNMCMGREQQWRAKRSQSDISPGRISACMFSLAVSFAN